MEKGEHKLAFPGARHQVRVDDLCSSHYVEVICENCQHVGQISPTTLQEKYPGHTNISDLAPWLRCQRCGVRGTRRWDVWQINGNT